MEEIVVIVGAGPSGLSTSACLNLLNIPNIILERENVYASLWKERSYDRLKLHLAKQFCHLPHMPYPPNAPTFVPRQEFIRYIDDYVSTFNIKPKYHRSVVSAKYDTFHQKWRIEVTNTMTGEVELYLAKFLVIATGENSKGYIPRVQGLEGFEGKVMHSSQYKSGAEYSGMKVLVVGCGNSGMEIAYDLSNYGASTSIVVRSRFHVLTKEMVYLGMVLLKYLPVSCVDPLINTLSYLSYGDLSKYGIHRPAAGAFEIKAKAGRSPVIDVGTVEGIKNGLITVMPGISRIEKNNIVFDNDTKRHHFDAIVFATGYRSTVNNWLTDDHDSLLGKSGMPKNPFPNHWKGANGLYCAGLSRRGLAGVSTDAEAIAKDIKNSLFS
ncbi:hypothetical protein MKW98_032294 [Papaver atlanticum]|uniref:Flavin-containing monooxygenase n=1 Tax=Papaver atlanticum TaxID=357466 RepID=A0AAD4SGV0_9MAGN|nr:hypothetical protein MKW98_032294 [Papaver atlanticum]